MSAPSRGQVSRRVALRLGAAAGAGSGAVAVAAAGPSRAASVPAALRRPAAAAVAAVPGVLDLYVNEGYLPMVDGTLVYHRGFGDRPTAIGDPQPSLAVTPRVFTATGQLVVSRTYPLGAALPPKGRPAPMAPDPRQSGEYLVHRERWASYFPARTIIAESGSTIRLRVHNRLTQPHALRLHGVPHPTKPEDLSTGPIPAGQTAELELTAPAPGTYVYSDPTNGDVERVLGLFGVLLVMSPDAPWRLKPGGTEFERQWLWMTHVVDPVWAKIASTGGTVDPSATPAVPRYFLLNGHSGFQSLGISRDLAANDRRKEETLMSGSAREIDVRNFSRSYSPGAVGAGQLIRLVNAGIVRHQMHFHGNHVWTVRRGSLDFPRDRGYVDTAGHVVLQQWEDVVELEALERKDSVLPLRRPPEVIDPVWHARKTDWVYPMHCHAEPSQTAAGGLYPGGLVADWVLAAPTQSGTATEQTHHLYRSQVDFSSDQIQEDEPVTEFKQTPDASISLGFFSRRLTFDDGAQHDIWSFETSTSGRAFPAPLIRVREGQVFHARLRPSKGPHTIHWHGMEPDPRNDGVGHSSFEVDGEYTYQWRPERGEAGNPNKGASGTYFYHCHVNTVLHAQMGMFGALIIDPEPHPQIPVGRRRVFGDGPEYDIDTETILIPYSVDPRWHTLDHAAGLSGEDAGLNRFDPKHFYLLGGELARRPRGDGVWSLARIRANVVGSAKAPTLLRVLNANYNPMTLRFTDPQGKPAAIGELVTHDGRPFRDTSLPDGYSPAATDTDSQLTTSVLAFGGAERYDMLLRPTTKGTYKATITWEDWITKKPLKVREVPIVVT